MEAKVVLSEGVYVVDKPFGWTSFDVVNKLKHIAHIKKIGHTGTLDPAATGVLVVCVGREYTKQIDSIMAKEKEYLAEITFNIETDSFDQEGKVLYTKDVKITQENIEKILPEFQGEITQIPPMHSAVHHQGKRLYELARKGIEVEREPRKVNIAKITMEEFVPGVTHPKVRLRIVCSKGTYIRVIAHDLGQKLGSGAFLSSLVRTRVGEYTIDQAVSIKQFISP